jgi:hypothetical protein
LELTEIFNKRINFKSFCLRNVFNLYNKRVCPTKNEPQQGISNLEREREGVKERGRRVSRSAGRHIKGLVRFGRDRGERQR